MTNESQVEPHHRAVVTSISGHQAERTRAVAQQTRRVVMTSQGVLQDRKAGRQRRLALAVAAAVVVLLAVTPLVWWAVDTAVAGEHLGEATGQIALWACTLCPALVAAALVAGWMQKPS